MGNQQPLDKPKDEYAQALEKSVFAESYIRDNIDFSLLTLGEWKLSFKLEKQHEDAVRRRARELRFSPETGLSKQERWATLKCMSLDELKPFQLWGRIHTKGERMMKELSEKEKVDVRIYVYIGLHFSEFGPEFLRMSDEDIFVWAQIYSQIMDKYGLPVFEKSYSFLSEEAKRRVLEAGSKLSPDEYRLEDEPSPAKPAETAEKESEKGSVKDNIVPVEGVGLVDG